MKKKKVKVIYKEDDGHTIYDMSGVVDKFGKNSYKSQNQAGKEGGVYLTKKEKRALIKAGFKYYLPYLGIMLVGLTVAFLLVYLWIS